MKKLFLLLLLSFFSVQSFAGSCPDGSDPGYRSISVDGSYYVYKCSSSTFSFGSFSSSRGIKTTVHYPIPIHLQPASRRLGYKEGDLPVTEKQAHEILSLPIHQYLTDIDLERVINTVNSFKS